MRKVIIGIIVLGLLLIAGFIFIPGLVPSSVYKEQIETQLSKELGRPVNIAGEVSLQSFPFVRAKTSGVSVDNLEGFSKTPFLSIDKLEARIRLLPLLSKRVEISGFELIQPQILLERRADGTQNWITPNSKETATADTTTETKPFLRDGRFQNLDPQIEAFTLVDGQITYRDAIKGETYDVKNIDGFLSLPGLGKMLELDLSLDFQGDQADIQLSFDNIRDFLDGNTAPIKATLTSAFAKIDIDGQFLASEKFDFTADVNANISDVEAIKTLSSQDIPYAELITRLNSQGNFIYKNNVLDVKEGTLRIEGNGLSVNYVGDAKLSETVVLDGRAEFDLSNFQAIRPYLPEDTPALEFLTSLKGSADLAGTPDGFTANNILANVEGQDLSGEFKGQATYAGEDISAKGRIKSDVADVVQLTKSLQIETPYAALLGSLSAQGDLTYEGNNIALSDLDARSENGAINGTYAGALSFNESPKPDGQFTLSIAELSTVTAVLPDAIPYSESVKTIAVSGRIQTEGDTFLLSALDAKLTDGLINGSFLGSGQYDLKDKNALSLAGKLDSQITDIRALAALNGTILPPDTQTGSIYDTFSLKGDLTGTPRSLTVKNAALAFDAISGTGDMVVTLSNTKPLIDSTLTLGRLDLRPYMASYSAQNPEGKIQPWNEAPLNVTPFQAVNGNFDISATEIITDRLTLGQTNMTATLRDGVLKANLPKLALYGGSGNMDMTFNAAKSTPELTLSMGLNQLNGNRFLNAIAGFTKASGEAKTELSITSSGKSQAEIMRGLNGQGGFNLLNGEIQGIDATEFLTGLDQALTSRTLPSGIGSGKTTKFNDIQSLFKIENGVVSVNKFDLAAIGFAASGQGNIDLGNQTMDFKFRPRSTREGANNLASFGIPVKFSGKFGEASASLDTDLLSQIVAERARAEAASRIRNEVKGPIGDILGGVLGGNNQTPLEKNTENEAETTPQSPEDAVTDALGGLFGIKREEETQAEKERKDSETPDDTKKKEEKKKEEKSDLEKALGSLFGE